MVQSAFRGDFPCEFSLVPRSLMDTPAYTGTVHDLVWSDFSVVVPSRPAKSTFLPRRFFCHVSLLPWRLDRNVGLCKLPPKHARWSAISPLFKCRRPWKWAPFFYT